MGMRFFKKWLLFWHPNFENISAYRYIRIFLFILRFILTIFQIYFWITISNEMKTLGYFEADDEFTVALGISGAVVTMYLFLELLILVVLYLYTKYHK